MRSWSTFLSASLRWNGCKRITSPGQSPTLLIAWNRCIFNQPWSCLLTLICLLRCGLSASDWTLTDARDIWGHGKDKNQVALPVSHRPRTFRTLRSGGAAVVVVLCCHWAPKPHIYLPPFGCMRLPLSPGNRRSSCAFVWSPSTTRVCVCVWWALASTTKSRRPSSGGKTWVTQGASEGPLPRSCRGAGLPARRLLLLSKTKCSSRLK